MKKNEIRLYNLILPLWLLIFMPPAVLVTIPVNFAVDSAVLLLAAHFVCPDFGKELWKKCILRVFIFGFLADFISAGILLALSFAAEKSSFSDFYLEAIFSPLSSFGSVVLLGCAVALAGVLIYIFDRFISLKKAERLDDRQKRRVALFMAVLTAPYSFFVPLNWLY